MNKEERRIRQSECNRLRYLRDRERILKACNEYRLKNKEIIVKRKHNEYMEDREKYWGKSKKWIAANIDRHREYKRSWSLANKDKISGYIHKYNTTHPEVKREEQHRRRTRKVSGAYENINSLVVYERDNWVCGLCSNAVDKKLKWPHPMSPSLDHVIALSCGGSHTYNNVQLAHLKCNVDAGNKNKELRMVG